MSFLDPKLCSKLRQYHFNTRHNVDFLGSLLFNGPCYTYGNNRLFNVALDSFSYITLNNNLTNTRIGRYCSVGSYIRSGVAQLEVKNVVTSELFTQNASQFLNFFQETLDCNFKISAEHYGCVEVGHDVWIGTKATLLGNVKIGHGAVIGAGAVISKDVPPYAVVVGNDRIIKTRFSDEVIDELLSSHWWDYNLPKMIQQGLELNYQDPLAVVKILRDIEVEKLIPISEQWIKLDFPNTTEPLLSVNGHTVDKYEVDKFFQAFNKLNNFG